MKPCPSCKQSGLDSSHCTNCGYVPEPKTADERDIARRIADLLEEAGTLAFHLNARETEREDGGLYVAEVEMLVERASWETATLLGALEARQKPAFPRPEALNCNAAPGAK